jgi:hypothetical protein
MCQFANYLTDYFSAPGDHLEKLNAYVPAGIRRLEGWAASIPRPCGSVNRLVRER